MERLQKRSDGFFETPSGLLGVKPLRHRLETSTYREFSFKPHPTEASIVVRWRKEDQIAVIDAGVAKTMLSLGYAAHVSEELAERWNALVAELELDAPAPEGNTPNAAEPPAAEPEPAAPAAEPEATKEEAAPEPEKAPNEQTEGTTGDATESGGEQSTEQATDAEEAPETEQQPNGDEAKPAAKAKKGSLV